MHTNVIATIAVPAIIIAAHKNGTGAFRYIVTIASRNSAQVYPCNSMATALNLAERVVTALTNPAAAH